MKTFVHDVQGVPAPLGKYANAVVQGGTYRTAYISGQIGANSDGSVAGPTLEAQTKTTLENLEKVLSELGMGPGDLVKVLTFAVGGPLDGFYRARDEIYARWFANGDYPAHSLAVVSALAREDLLVEIEAVACASNDEGRQ